MDRDQKLLLKESRHDYSVRTEEQQMLMETPETLHECPPSHDEIVPMCLRLRWLCLLLWPS